MITTKLAAWRRKASGFTQSVLALSLLCSVASAAAINVSAGKPLVAQEVPQAVTAGQVPRLALLPAAQHLKLSLSLQPRNQDQLNQLLQDLYDPASPNYHHYLSVDEFTAQFGPSQADYDNVVSWATANGFTVTDTTPNRRLVEVDGDVNTINAAFHLTMGSYQHPTEARQFFAPDQEPTVNLSVQLLAVTGLDNFTLPHNHLKKGKPRPTAIGPVANAGSGPSGEYLPSDMRAAYYGSGSLTGAGQSIGIFSFDGYKTADLTVYKNGTGMSFSTPVNNVLVSGYSGVCDAGDGSGTSTCDDGEQILDIVNAIGMAPGITQILFYEGTSATPILNKMASDNSAKVLSSSWGGGGFNNTTDDPIYQEMAAQGQTFLNATGDEGAYNSSTWLAPSADANVLEVGGTDLTTASAGGAWSSETGWPDSGGGFISSAGEATPSYQKLAGVITTTNKGSTTYRNDPDVAMEANFDNPTASNGSFETGYGGTSFAAPRWAGYIALVNQQSVANGNGTVGFVNPALYNLGLAGGNFHDVTSGNNKPTAGSGTGFNATAGYDLVTGWGSPNGATLLNALAGGSTGTADFSLSASPSSVSVTQGGNGTSTITIGKVNGFSSSVALSASGLPSGVTAAFSPASATTTSALTLTASSTATVGSATVTITGTSGSLTHTTTVSLTVASGATPDFSLSASPSTVSVVQGGNGSSTVSVAASGGFTGSVALAASGLPTGVTAAFSPASTTSTSTLTLTASSTATTGTATVTVTGTSGTLSHSTTVSLTVTAPTGGNVLQNGVAVTGLAATKGAQLAYTMVVPAGATGLQFVISGGTGDADMYVKFGSAPTLTSYDCRPYVTGNSETCTIATAQAGTYYVMLNAYATFSGVSLTGSYTTGGGGGGCGGTVLCNGTAVTGLSGTSGTLSGAYTFVVPAGATNATIAISGGTGDADLYVKLGSAPTLTSYTCRPYVTGNTESCTLSGAGTYYIKINAYATYSGVSLLGKYTP